MDAWFVWMLIFLGIGGLVFALSRMMPVEQQIKTSSGPVTHDNRGNKMQNMRTVHPRRAARRTAYTIFGIAVFLLIMSCWTMVGTNKIAVFTSMNAPYTATDNGFEGKRPWAKKTEFDASRQFLRFCKDGNNDEDPDKKEFPKVHLRIDGNATADICGTITWQMKATTKAEKVNAISLMKEYKVFSRVASGLVYPSIRVALNTVLATQNPLVAERNKKVSDINKDTFDALKDKFGDSIIILAVDISPPDYDEKTDEAISADLAQKALTNLAKEKALTNIEEANANSKIQASVQDPMILINKCLDIAKQLNYNPGLCLMGGGSVILPGDTFSRK